MRVVLDSNEYISAFVFGGPPRTLLERAEQGLFELVVSPFIQAEVAGVLTSSKFGWTAERASFAAKPLWAVARAVNPKKSIAACRDEGDNRVLECAVEAEAQVIVTRDKDLLVLNPFQGQEIT